jgi:hypothetical protein
MQDNEFAIFRGTPSTAKALLRNITPNSMKRTTNNQGNYFYRGIMYESLRVIVDTNNKIITFQRDLKISNGTRREGLRYNFEEMTLCKMFKEPEFIPGVEREKMYPFAIDEGFHFMESTIQDKFFPLHEDYVKMEALKDYFIEDVYKWIKERDQAHKDRRHESWLKWQELKNRKFKGRYSSS